MGAGIPAGDEDGVVLRRVELAEGSHGELAVRDPAAFGEIEAADADHVVVAVELMTVERVADHCGVLLIGSWRFFPRWRLSRGSGRDRIGLNELRATEDEAFVVIG